MALDMLANNVIEALADLIIDENGDPYLPDAEYAAATERIEVWRGRYADVDR